MGNTFEIKNNIYFTGVVDKDLEVFDIIMKTEFGTTYNSYLIKDEKTVLFDTVKSTFKDAFLNNLSELTDIKDIDYVVIHHTEPDHAGSLKYLLDINPNITVYCTKVAKMYLESQINKPFNCHTITDGEILNIGSRNLQFITAPFLHWPDTMFTHIKEDKVLLTCDAFGSHYSNTNASCATDEDYLKSAKHYYDCIVRPFAKHVINAINKVVSLELEFDTILTSHGPILSENPMASVKRYLDWSNEAIDIANNSEISIFYLSAYTNTYKMAKSIGMGIEKEGCSFKLYDLENMNIHEIHDAIMMSKVILLGSPTINKTMVKPMWDLFSIIDPMITQGKIGGVFGSFGWSGEGITIAEMLLKSLGFKIPVATIKKKFSPNEETYEECMDFGKQFVQLIK